MKANLKIKDSVEKKGFQHINFEGKWEIMKMGGRRLVTVTALSRDRMAVQTLSLCMDCEIGLFARDSQAEMPLASPKGAQGLGFSMCFEGDVYRSSVCITHWKRLYREAVDAPSLKVFRTRLYGPVRNLV